MSKMIKADLKHWLTAYGPNEELDINYNRVVGQAVDKLGIGGVVGVINARGPDNELGSDDRFEKFLAMGEKYSSIDKLGGDGRVFRDNNSGIYFIKGQEISSAMICVKSTYLIYNIPFNQNLNEEDGHVLNPPDRIKILNLPSFIVQFNESSKKLDFSLFDGIITHASSMEIFPWTNRDSEKFYDSHIKDKYFHNLHVSLNPEDNGANHKIGALAVSGGHEVKSLGSSFTELPEFIGNTQQEFFDWFRNSIQNSTPKNIHKGSCAIETLVWYVSRKIKRR